MKRKQKELPLDDIIRSFILAAQRMDKIGGELKCHITFGAKPEQPKPAKVPRS